MGDGILNLIVQDNGKGIKKEQYDELFEYGIFETENMTNSNGKGLGLKIS